MGTTQRIVPSVPGQPNWGDLSTSITYIAKTVEKEIAQEEEEEKQTQTPEDSAKIHKKLIDKRTLHVKSAFNSLIKTGGGRRTISSGKSSSIGRAGLKSTKKLVKFFANVSTSGLTQALKDIGFDSFTGKTITDVIDYLLVYCCESSAGLDETAANKASCELLNEIAIESGNDISKFEELIKESVEGIGLANLLCKFWGLYIFEHLSQRFQEKITQLRGDVVSSQTFKIIKDDIMGQIKVLNSNRPIDKINWQGKDGEKTIESIFDSIIKIISDEKNN